MVSDLSEAFSVSAWTNPRSQFVTTHNDILSEHRTRSIKEVYYSEPDLQPTPENTDKCRSALERYYITVYGNFFFTYIFASDAGGRRVDPCLLIPNSLKLMVMVFHPR